MSGIETLDLLRLHVYMTLDSFKEDFSLVTLLIIGGLLKGLYFHIDLVLDLFFSHPSYSLLQIGTFGLNYADRLGHLEASDTLGNCSSRLLEAVKNLIWLITGKVFAELSLHLLVLCLHMIK